MSAPSSLRILNTVDRVMIVILPVQRDSRKGHFRYYVRGFGDVCSRDTASRRYIIYYKCKVYVCICISINIVGTNFPVEAGVIDRFSIRSRERSRIARHHV